MNSKLLCVYLTIALSASAGAPGLQASMLVLPARYGDRQVAVGLDRVADFVCATVHLRCSAKTIERQGDLIQGAVATIKSAAETNPDISIRQGSVTVDREPSSLPLFDRDETETTVHILQRLRPDSDAFAIVKGLHRFVRELPAPTGVVVRMRGVSLAIEDPERFRTELLQAITDHVTQIRTQFHAESVTVSGLENRVSLVQIDERRVELFINFELSLSVGAGSRE